MTVLRRAAVLALFPALLAGCGRASSEKLAEVGTALAALSEMRAHAEETFDALYDDALFVRITEAGKSVDACLETDAAAMTDDEIDAELLPALQEMSETYAELQELLDQTAAAEEAERREQEGKKRLTFHVLNRSGESFPSLIWMQGTGAKRTTLLTVANTLAENETLAGLTVEADESEAGQTLYLRGADSGDEEEVVPEYAVGKVSELEADGLFYLILLPEGQSTLTTDPASLAEGTGDVSGNDGDS